MYNVSFFCVVFFLDLFFITQAFCKQKLVWLHSVQKNQIDCFVIFNVLKPQEGSA